MPVIPVLAYAGLAAMAVGAIGQIDQTRRARKATQAQMEAERRRSEIENVRNARQQVRQARIAQASIINQGGVGGTLSSSGVQGGVASVGSQMAGNVNYMASIAEENTNIFNSAVTSAKASTNANIFGQVGQLGQTMFSTFYGGVPKKAP